MTRSSWCSSWVTPSSNPSGKSRRTPRGPLQSSLLTLQAWRGVVLAMLYGGVGGDVVVALLLLVSVLVVMVAVVVVLPLPLVMVALVLL